MGRRLAVGDLHRLSSPTNTSRRTRRTSKKVTKRQSPRVGIAVLAAIVALLPGAVPARGWGGEYKTLEGWTIVQFGFLDAPFLSPDAPYEFSDRQYGIRQFCFVSREKFNRIGEDAPAILLRKENNLGVAAIRYDILLYGIIDFIGNIEKVSCPDEENHRADPGLPRRLKRARARRPDGAGEEATRTSKAKTPTMVADTREREHVVAVPTHDLRGSVLNVRVAEPQLRQRAFQVRSGSLLVTWVLRRPWRQLRPRLVSRARVSGRKRTRNTPCRP